MTNNYKNNKNKKDKEKKLEIIDVAKELDDSKEYMEKFQKAKTFNRDRQDAYAENMAFYQGNQHLLKKYKSEVPWVLNMNTPYATVAIDNRVSSLLANDYIGALQPLSPDDVETIDSLEKLFKKEWERMNIDQVVRESIKKCAVVREAYCHIVLDADKVIGGNNKKRLGALSAYLIGPSQIYIDPTARCLKNARYMFIADRISKDEAKDKYSKIKSIINSGDNFTPQDRGEVYFDNDYETEQDDVFTVLTYYGKKKGKIEKVKIINGVIVEKKTDKEAMNLKNFPILQMRWKKAEQSCYGLSLMDEVLSLQKAVNSIESSVTNTAIAYAAPSMMVRKGCGVDPAVVAKASGAPGVVYSVDGNLDNAIKPVVPPRIENSILQIKNDFETKINQITGNSSQFLGDIGTAGNTSSGAKVAVERAKIIEVDVLNNISEYVEDITNTVIEYITQIYHGETVSVYDGKSGKGVHQFSDIVVPEQDKLEGAQFKYYIELETKTPYSKERQKELLLELYTLERQYDTPTKVITPTDIVKNSDLENKDEIVERYNQMNYQDAMTKTDTILQLNSAATEIGVSPDLVKQAIAEIINSAKETPAVDEVLKQMEQGFQQQVQQNQQKLNNVAGQLSNTPQSLAEIDRMTQEQLNGGTQPPTDLSAIQQIM